MASSGIDFSASDTASSGAWQVDGVDLVAIDAAASHEGWTTHKIDFNGIDSLARAIEQVTAAVGAPWFAKHGREGLLQALIDLDRRDSRGHLLLIDNASALRSAAAVDFTRLLDIFEDASTHWVERGRPFWAFVALDDADFDGHGG